MEKKNHQKDLKYSQISFSKKDQRKVLFSALFRVGGTSDCQLFVNTKQGKGRKI
jgi:hypothetical protein